MRASTRRHRSTTRLAAPGPGPGKGHVVQAHRSPTRVAEGAQGGPLPPAPPYAEPISQCAYECESASLEVPSTTRPSTRYGLSMIPRIRQVCVFGTLG